eukprot:1711876-Pyramimonas_sp.AAC.1
MAPRGSHRHNTLHAPTRFMPAPEAHSLFASPARGNTGVSKALGARDRGPTSPLGRLRLQT